MAHVGQKFRLGQAGGLGLPFGPQKIGFGLFSGRDVPNKLNNVVDLSFLVSNFRLGFCINKL
jgi:hypothetical protein